MLHVQTIDVDSGQYCGVDIMITNQDPEWLTFLRSSVSVFFNCDFCFSGPWDIEPHQARAHFATKLFYMSNDLPEGIITARSGSAFGFRTMRAKYAPFKPPPLISKIPSIT